MNKAENKRHWHDNMRGKQWVQRKNQMQEGECVKSLGVKGERTATQGMGDSMLLRRMMPN